MRIAIIGSGISGLSAAYLLSPHAEVTVYEREAVLGGHAHTVTLQQGSESIAVDTGFMVFNPLRYPYFTRLLSELGIESKETTMSFSVSIPNQVEYSSSYGGLFGDLRQVRDPRFIRLLYDIVRFNTAAKQYLAHPSSDSTELLSEFLSSRRYSPELASWYLYPLMGSIWSASPSDMRSYPALETFRFLDNHLLLNTFVKPTWHTISGGSIRYVESLAHTLRSEGVRILQGSPVTSVERTEHGVTISSHHDETYDTVVLATHADDALSLLSDSSAEEKDALSGFEYTKNTIVLHSDTSYMPTRTNAWAAWNYRAPSSGHEERGISLTYNMNILQHIPSECPMFVTLNPEEMPDSSLTHNTYKYAHPVMNAVSRDSQKKIETLQGVRRTYFGGAHLGHGFHEDGIHSAVRIIEHMGLHNRLV